MNFIYTKLMSWLLGEAIANSDRIKVAVFAAAGVVLAQVAGACQVCSSVLTPTVTAWISSTIAGGAVALIAALSHRDIAAPGQVVSGAAVTPPPAA